VGDVVVEVSVVELDADPEAVPDKALFSRRKYISAMDIFGVVSFLDRL